MTYDQFDSYVIVDSVFEAAVESAYRYTDFEPTFQ